MAKDDGYKGKSWLVSGRDNPAAPAGLRQNQERFATQQQDYSQGRSILQPWTPQYSMLETAKSWYTGANNEGIQNGWDTTFYKNAFNQYDQWQQKAMDSGKQSTFFNWLNPDQNKQATGVATWGADPTDEAAKKNGDLRFGDIFNNGQKVANLYDDYDKQTADVMVGEFLFSNDEKSRVWQTPGSDPSGKPTLNPEYSQMVEDKRKQNTDQALYSKSAESYDERVKAEEVRLRKGQGDEGNVVAGALGGAAVGAGAGFALGTAVPIVGNVVGAVVGGVVGAAAGGITSYLNEDQLIEMHARANIKADEADKEFGDNWLQKSTMNLGEYSQLAMKYISPLGNLSQGVQDARLGKVGDMTAEFYETNPDGTRKVGWAGRGVDIAASLGDGVLQFASPVGAWLYMGSMTGVVAGKVGEMSTGSVFNERRGEYDKLDNWQEWASAVGSTAIDAAQVGVAGAFGKAARSARGLVTGEKAASTFSYGAKGRIVMEEASTADRAYAKVLGRGEAKYATTQSGIRFLTGESGEVLSTRISFEALAPSESLRWIETGWRARKLARIDKGEMTRDHVLKAAIDLQSSTRLRNAVMLGYTEGGEEAVQAWLDPQRTGDKGKFSDYFEAALYGAAGGIGMGMGRSNKMPNSRQQMEARAFAQRTQQLGRVPTVEEWNAETSGFAMKDFEKIARTTDAEDTGVNAMLKRFADNHRQETAHHSSIGYYRLDTMNQEEFEKRSKKALEEGNGSMVLLGQTTEFLTTNKGTVEQNKFSANSGVMSAGEAINQLGLISKGTQAQLDKVQEELSELPAAAGDEHVESLRSERKAREADLLAQVQVAKDVSTRFLQMYNGFRSMPNPTEDRIAAGVEEINTELRNAYMGAWRDDNGNLLPPEVQKRVQKAVEIRLGRHPFQDRGSFAVVLPQISVELTRLNASGQIHVQQGMLKAINGDHDGDTIVPLHTTYMAEDALAKVRRGDQYMQPTEDPKTKKTKVKVVISNPDGEWAIMDSISNAMLDTTSRSAQVVTQRLDGLAKQIRAEFSDISNGPLDDGQLQQLLSTFKESVLAGREDSRMNLVEGMVNLNYPGVRSHTPGDNVSSVQWLWTLINQNWDILVKDLAHVRATESTKPTITAQRETHETTIRTEIARQDAATASASLGLLTSDPVRGGQHLHYSSLFRGLTEFDPATTMTTDQQQRLTQLFMELGNSQTERDIQLLTSKNAVEERVYYWLQMMAKSMRDPAKSRNEVLMLVANVAVPSVNMKAVNKFEVTNGEITMLQLLLRRSLDIEQERQRAAAEDSPEAKKIRTLRRLTYRDPDRSKRSTTASLALLEVLGNRTFEELIGDSSSYIGPQLTANQLYEQQRGLHPNARNREFERLKRQPAYIKAKDRGFKDAPWPKSVLESFDTKISAYTILIDAVKVAGDTYLPKMRDRNATIQEAWIQGHHGLQTSLAAHKRKHGERLAGEKVTEPIEILRDMLAHEQRIAPEIAANLIPEAAALGVFQVHPDGTVTASKWLERMLVEPDSEKAAAMYYFNIKTAEFIQRAGTVDLAKLDQMDDEGVEKALGLEDIRGRIRPETLKSRYLQVMWHLASQPDKIELFRFLKAMENANSVDEMFEQINKEPMWRNDQAELLAWYDDVSDWEVDPSAVWSSGGDGSLQRDNIRTWGQRMQVLGDAALEAATTYEANKNLLHGIDQWYKTKGSPKPVIIHDGATYGGLLKQAVQNRKRVPDYQGQAARTQLVELQMVGIAAVHNKGVADPKAAPFGEPLITLDSFGYSDGLRQELASLTAEDVEDVLTNLSKLAQGPVRMMMENGATLTFDITTEEKALAMLMDPRTQGLAMSILFPTVRDVDKNNTVQTYLDTDAKTTSDNKGNLAQLLRESNFSHLFNKQADFEGELKQAHRYIGHLESYVRNQAVGSDNPEVLEKSFMPVQKAVHDFITAYLHSKDVKESNYPNVRNQIFIEVANAIKAAASVDPSVRPRMRNTIAGIMSKRFLSDPTALNQLLNDDDVAQQMEQIMLVTKQSELYSEGLDDIDSREAAAPTQVEKDAIAAERDAFTQEWEQLHGNFGGYEHLTFLDAISALSMFKGQDGLKTSYNKAEILAYLGKSERIHRQHRKDKYKFSLDGADFEVNAQRLYHKFKSRLEENPLDQEYAPEEWEVLANWAAQIYLEDTTSRASSAIPSGPSWMGEEGEAVKRYSDQSWMYLTDPLFDEGILEAANFLSQEGTYYQQRGSEEVAKELTEGILSEKRLGTWTRVIVNESMKTRMILKNSTVGAAVTQDGNDPKVMADYLGAGKITWERPEAGHFTEDILTGDESTRLFDLLTDPLALVKLENHFVTEVVVESTDPSNPLDPVLADAFQSCTVVNETNKDTEDAGRLNSGQPPLRVLDLQKLDERIEWLKGPPHNLRGFTVRIKYVDVNKQPHEARWANNIYFDGVGREAVGGSSMGAVASLFFGLNGLSKVGQQNPLDAATKQGMAFKPHKRSDLDEVKNLQPAGSRVSQVLAAKAVHMLNKNYPMGPLLRADLPSMYKLQKMRHVVVGTNANGEKEVWWAHQAIVEEEQAGSLTSLQNWELVELSDRVAQTLLGRSGPIGVRGTPGSLVQPTFNIQDLDIFPSLDAGRLAWLGLDGLGTVAELGNSRLAQVNYPAREASMYGRGEDYPSLYKKKLLEWRGESKEVLTRRSELRTEGKGKLDISNNNTTKSQLIINMLDSEKQALTARPLGIPERGVMDMAALQVSRTIAAQLYKAMPSPNSMIWVHTHGAQGDLAKGIVGRADIEDNFAGYNGMGPVHGDVVILDLTDLMATVDVHSYEKAADKAAEILKVYAKKGVTVALQSTGGQLDLRAKVTEDLTDGSLGYRQMGDSPHFFTPITEDADFNAAQRALSSSLLQTQQFLTKNMSLRLVADNLSTNLSESTEYVDVPHDRAAYSISHTVLPYRMLSTGSVGRRNPRAYNEPQRGTGRADQLQKVNAQLLELLQDPLGRAYLKELLGPEKLRENALGKGYPQYRENPNGTIEHGVLSLDDALDKLQKTIEAQKWPLDKGETFYWGTIVPFVSGDGSIHLQRIGFKPPGNYKMEQQRETILYRDKPLKITGSLSKLDKNQTLPPPTRVDEARPTDTRGFGVIGTHRLNPLAKGVDEGLGLKTGQTPMPRSYQFPDADIKAPGAAGMRPSRLMGSTSVIGKEAMGGLGNNFRDLFMITGVNFEDDMIDFFFGENPGRSEDDRANLWDLTSTILKDWSLAYHPYTETELAMLLDNRSAMLEMELQLNALGAAAAKDQWTGVKLVPDLQTQQSPNGRLGTVILATLAAPGVRLDHVIGTAGATTVSDHDGKLLVRQLPALMTDYLNDMDHPELRRNLIARLNRNMPTRTKPDGTVEPWMWFDEQLKFNVIMTQEAEGGPREEQITGYLQVHVPIPADENSIRLTYAGVDSSGEESQHIASTIAGAVGGRLATKTRKHPNLPEALNELYGENEIERFEDPDDSAAAFFHVLTRLRTNSPEYNPWGNRTPMEEEHFDRMNGKLRQYNYRGVRSEETGWSTREKKEGNRLADELLGMLKIRDEKARVLVEEMARQLLGIPGPAQDQEDYTERLSYEMFQTAVEYMKRNVEKGRNPLYGGVVPHPHEMTWKRIFDAQQNLPVAQRWLPLANANRRGKGYVKADDWGQWVNAVMGQTLHSVELFDDKFRTDLDAFMSTYQGTHPDYMDMSTTTDPQLQAKFLRSGTEDPWASLDPGYDAVLAEAIVLSSQTMTYDALVGAGAVHTQETAEEASASVLARRVATMKAWQEREGLPKQKDASVREYIKKGQAYQESSSSTSNLMRNLVNASVMVRLFNPALYASAAFEVPFRSALEGFTNILTGQLTGRAGRTVAGAAAKLEQGLTKMGMEGLSITPRYSVDDINVLNDLNQTMGASNRFKGLVYGELAYQSAIAAGRGKIGGLLERGAAGAALLTADPLRGFKQPTLAKRYNDSAWEYLTMTNSQITIQQYAFQMKNDPTWLEKNDPEAHRMGLNAVNQSRGAKNTMLGNTIMAPIDKLMTSKSFFLQGSGLLLKIPFLFTRFNANMLLTLTGLHGFDQVAAMFFDGRERSPLIVRMLNNAKKDGDAADTPSYWDLSDTIESIDLSRAFVRGAVTQTALFSMAMLAGGFSLGGEDEEERRRKRLATYLNTPYYHDPRTAANDFRWTDAIFLDNVPILGNIYVNGKKEPGLFTNETTHAAVAPHWIFRQFLSPVLGMMRFFETGNFYEIVHGFRESASVMPTSVARLWSEADLTSGLLLEAADNEELIPEKEDKRRQLALHFVLVYEKALIENSFINGLYQAGDDFDRNPWAVVDMKNGTIVREPGTNEPVASKALRTVKGEDEILRDKYVSRTGWDALRHQYAEGNATAAFLMSVIPWVQGQDSTYLRGNMVVKKQYVQLDQTPKDKVEALVYATYLGRGGQPSLTKEEIIGAIKQREQAAGRWWDQGKVEAEATKIYETVKDKPLTVFDHGGKEVMTLDGKGGVFRSLRDGVIGLDSPTIRGFNVSQAERDAIAEELTTELVQEGINLGLGEQAAMYRMRRIWYGDPTNPSAPGLREILYDKHIPSKPYAEYDQLNVTYTLGPDGKPWATPFQRSNMAQVFGIPLPHQMAPTIPGQTTYDQRGNVVDLVRGINTGLAAVVPRPLADDIKPNDDAVKKAQAKTYTPGKKAYSRRPWRNFGRRGFGRRGGGGGGFGGGGGGGPFFSQLRALPQGTSPRIDDVPMINTNNPIIRRADVRRERITSERGRLKQWQ